MEGHQWRNIDRGARTGHGMDRPFEVGILFSSSWYVPMSDKAPPPAMSPDETVVSAATAFVQGANVYGAMAPGHSGVYDENADMRGLRAAGAWLRENREWIAGAEPYAEIGIVGGRPSAELAGAARRSANCGRRFPNEARPASSPAPNSILRCARRATSPSWCHQPSRPGATDLARYRMLVLPENALLDTGLAGSIREYVRGGGRLLAFGHASLLGRDGRTAVELLCSPTYSGSTSPRRLPGYKQFAAGSDIAASLPLNTPSLGVRPTTAKVLATLDQRQ